MWNSCLSKLLDRVCTSGCMVHLYTRPRNRLIMHYLYSFIPSFLVRRHPVPPTAAEIRIRSARREETFRLH